MINPYQTIEQKQSVNILPVAVVSGTAWVKTSWKRWWCKSKWAWTCRRGTNHADMRMQYLGGESKECHWHKLPWRRLPARRRPKRWWWSIVANLPHGERSHPSDTRALVPHWSRRGWRWLSRHPKNFLILSNVSKACEGWWWSRPDQLLNQLTGDGFFYSQTLWSQGL